MHRGSQYRNEDHIKEDIASSTLSNCCAVNRRWTPAVHDDHLYRHNTLFHVKLHLLLSTDIKIIPNNNENEQCYIHCIFAIFGSGNF